MWEIQLTITIDFKSNRKTLSVDKNILINLDHT